jgi:alkyl sulfatase BDS1-like metallo-beta-lactamase superfamily hydrolase
MLAQLKVDLVWLHDQVVASIRNGAERSEVHQANLIPPDLLTGRPDVFQPYLILREHVIDRLYDQNVGYWQADLEGLDHLGKADRAELFADYLGLSEKQIAKAAERLAADGKYELAAYLLESSSAKFPHSNALVQARQLVYLKLMEKNQNTDPFKFIIYSGQIGAQTPPAAGEK